MHTRLSRCALEVEDSRAFWARADEATSVSAQQAFDEYWFGARSLARVEVLLSNMRSASAPSLRRSQSCTAGSTCCRRGG